MTATGGGPSRRSHTKSRKGCKTCKRRHIRCDETFPQCRNCTKHQVRCDYMDTHVADIQPPVQPVADLSFPQPIEATLDRWQQSGECVLGSFRINIHAQQGHVYTRNDLRLIYQALWSANHPQTTEFTVWSGKTPKFLAAATSHPFLVHAILAFGSQSLAWERNSADAKNLAYYHGGIALQGLQNAISQFSRENADAVLAASILLSWQANDWRSWSSLVSGIRTVINSMQAWKAHSYLADIMLEQEVSIPQNFPGFVSSPFFDDFHNNASTTLHQIHDAIENLQAYLFLREEEAPWVEQLKDYITQLQGVRPATSPEEQFNHLYSFRKWLFWIPTALLQADNRDYQTLLILAYYYATALQLEPLYPNVSAAFCSTMVLKPLEEIFKTFAALQQSTLFPDQQMDTLIALLQYPKQVYASYNDRKLRRESNGRIPRLSPPGFDRFGSEIGHTYEDYRWGSHASPAFPPQHPLRHKVSDISCAGSGLGSPYLEVPNLQWGDTSSASSLDSKITPSSFALPSISAGFDTDDMYGFSKAAMEYGGATSFTLTAPPLWA